MIYFCNFNTRSASGSLTHIARKGIGLPQIEEQIKTRAFIDFSAEETERLQAVAPEMPLGEIMKESLKLLATAIDALKSGREFGSEAEDGSGRRIPRLPALDGARANEARYASLGK